MAFADIEKRNKYITQYNKQKYKYVAVQLDRVHDADIIEKLEDVKKNGSLVEYVRKLVRRDMGIKDCYIVVDNVRGDCFTEEFDSLEKAIAHADKEWNHLSEHDKKCREAYYILKSVNSDEDAENHLDGDVVKEYK